MSRKLIIFGTNDLAELAYYYLKNDINYSRFEIIGFTVEKQFKTVNTFQNLPVFNWEELHLYSEEKERIRLLAPVSNNILRERIYKEGIEKGFKFTSYISDKATVLTDKIGKNCFILENNTLQPFTTIGNNVIMWSGNHFGHHSTIQDNTFITSHVVISGHCNIGKSCYLGVNSTIRDGITIEDNVTVGMGALVTKNCLNGKTYIGSPAKIKE